NSRRLVEVASRAGARGSLLVQRATELPWEEIDPDMTRTIGLSAGASAPEIIVDEIIDAFRDKFDVRVELAETAVEDENFPVMRDLRDVELTPADMAFVNGSASG
ncbi:MAG: 4-hydroxy-3-methylbut-2-enyl diphosphate reductase, partial [Hyphomicrobiales bacterium]|nr:4-hydroxy-3-methylbut-2-enyl diphosphate reductase [Hyphomicrobiales bacterium]